MKWSFTGDAPIYAQLTEQLKAGIVTGVYPSGQRLPSVRELAAEAGVNPNTMQRSLARLEEAGLVCSMRTAGRFVTEDREAIEQAKQELARQHIRRFRESMEHLGYSSGDALALLAQDAQTEGELYGSSGM